MIPHIIKLQTFAKNAFFIFLNLIHAFWKGLQHF